MGSLAEDRPRAMRLADILKALAHPARLRIVAVLCDRNETVIGIAERLDIKQAIVSQQLRILRMSGLVAATRENGFSVYGLAEPRLRDLVSCLGGCQRGSAGGAALEAAGGGTRAAADPLHDTLGFTRSPKAAARKGAIGARKEGVGR
jgi:DNA-binding transcriptional ArsR family regulator